MGRDKIRQDNRIQGKKRKSNPIYNNTRQYKAIQHKITQSKIRYDKARCGNTR